MLQRLIGEPINLRIQLDPNAGQVVIDSGQLHQVIWNLAVNARDAMPQGGRLTIRTRAVYRDTEETVPGRTLRPGPHIEFTMSDTGVGMSEEVLRHLFEPFFTTKSPGMGSGLGLATVYGIVQQAKGMIHITSRPHEGTTVTILFPDAGIKEIDDSPKSSVPVPRKGSETILLVEDEPIVRDLARLVLQRHGYHVVTAESPQEALDIVRLSAEPLAMVVTDIVMPGMSGRELVEILRQRQPGLRILYMSGYTRDEIVRYGVESSKDSFLQKPFQPAMLASKVREILDQPVSD
jgi:CheY-like chemotaxis protein